MRRISKTVALGAAATMTTAALATGSAIADDRPQGAAPRAGSATSTGVKACDGGASAGIKTRTVSRPTTFGEAGGALQDVPGARVVLNGPRHGKDTYLVTFTGEGRLYTTDPAGSWLELQVHRNNAPIQPFANNADPFAFASANYWDAHSGQFCVRLGRGRHVLQAKVRIYDGTGGSLSAWLDDYTFTVQRYR